MISIYRKRISALLFFSFLFMQIAGCATHSDIKRVRELPGVTHDSSYKDAYYDSSILAYRLKGRKNFQKNEDEIVRDPTGKKVRTEEELKRVAGAKLSELGKEKKQFISVSVLSIIYLPVSAFFGIVEGIIYSPFSLTLGYYNKKLKQNAETAYISGRNHFNKNDFVQSIAEFERALYLMPSLRAESDIDYWCGRAFEANGEIEEAKYSYLMFIEYSERTVPVYFNNRFSDDPLWLEKAKEVQSKIIIN